RLRRPQAQGVYVRSGPAGDWRVVRTGDHGFGRLPPGLRWLVGVGNAAEVHHVVGFGSIEFPWMTQHEPFFRLLHLPTIGQALAEQSVLVANAVPDRRFAERHIRIVEVGSDTYHATYNVHHGTFFHIL